MMPRSLRYIAHIVVLLAGLGWSVEAMAQDDLLEYRWSIGGGVGMVMPISDGVGFMQSVNAGLTATARRNFNPRMALGINVAMLHMSGDTKGTFLPADANSGSTEGGAFAHRTWSRNALDVSCTGELNFWGYGEGPRYKGNKRLTPYMLMGLGVIVCLPHNEGTNVAMTIPVGVGAKYKIGHRLNLAFEWRFTFTTTDKFEADGGTLRLDDPLGIHSTGMKNKDQHSTMMLTLTYDISPKYRRCNN